MLSLVCLLGFATCWFGLLVRFGMFVGVVGGLCLLMFVGDICAFSICASCHMLWSKLSFCLFDLLVRVSAVALFDCWDINDV